MAEFYVELNVRSNGDYIVHKADCPELPGKDVLRYLGSIASCNSAVKKAGQMFRQVNGCSQCAVACHTA